MASVTEDSEIQDNIKPVESQVWLTKSHVLLKRKAEAQTLWYSRENGSLFVGSDIDKPVHGLPSMLCTSYGLIGKIQFPDKEWYLLMMKEVKFVGSLPPTGGNVYCIESVMLVPLSIEKSFAEIKMETYVTDRREKDIKDKGKLERKLKDALLQMFNNSQSFYFSYDVDLTQSLQRQHDCGDANKLRKWQRVDERFFWNKQMLADLIQNEALGPEIDSWVLPVIQGYIEIKHIPIPSSNHLGIFEKDKPADGTISLAAAKEVSLESSVSTTVDTIQVLTDTSLLECNQDVLTASTPQSSPNNVFTTREQNNEAQPEESTGAVDNVSFHSCDTDDLMNERFEGVSLEDTTTNDTKDKSENALPWPKDQLQMEEPVDEELPLITMAVISRRNHYRAGTRYLRRGVDDNGHVANYVETEMILKVGTHVVSFMIVRGSVPVYWTQPGHKYRPTPIIQQSDAETAYAFERHFEAQINLYREQILINLINQSGREKILSTAYEKNLLKLDCPSLTYVAFDFHHHCKLNQWHNINLLLDNIEGYITRQKFFWVDLSYEKGPLCVQQGVFRVNCMDCLDRTNVVQSVLCKEVVQAVLQKLGLLSPFGIISGNFLRHYQSIWANNGDAISKQYTGTAAMKGDLTRYGQRRLYGFMRDGYNSAHRYLQSVFRDAYRQVVIDLQQGVSPQDAIASLSQSQKGWEEDQVLKSSTLSDLPSWSSEREQAIAEMISVCRNNLYPNTDVIIKGWALIEPAGYSFVPTSDKEEETVLLLCQERRHICIANYNSDFEQVACCIRIPLERIERLCIGHIGTILRSSRRLYMRLHYTLFPGCSCYFTFRSVHTSSLEEDKLTLLKIAEDLIAIQPTISIQEQRLSKKRSQPHEGIVFLIAPSEWAKDDWETILVPRSTSKKEEERVVEDKPVFYERLSSSSSGTPTQYHSRQSSSTSGIVALINLSDHNDQNESENGTDSSNDDAEVSFSAPSSPNFRRADMITLQERSRLFSHSSLEDLKAVFNDEDNEQKDAEKSVHHKKRRRSFGFVVFGSTSTSSETDDEESVNIDQVLSTSRIHSSSVSNTNIIIDDDDDLLPMRPRIPSPQYSNPITTTAKKNSPKPAIEQDSGRQSVSPILSSVQATSDFDKQDNNEISDSTNSITKSSSSSYFSRLGKLFQKARAKSNSERSEPEPNSEQNNVVQAIGILKGLKTKEDSEQDIESTNEETSEEQWIRNAMEHSKTRFIII